MAITRSITRRLARPPPYLRKLPVEVRAIIFDETIEEDGVVVPALIVALRGEPELYFEALEVLYKKSLVPIDKLKSIKKATLARVEGISFGTAFNVNKIPKFFQKYAKNITKVRVDCKDAEPIFEWAYDTLKLVTSELSSIKEIHLHYSTRGKALSYEGRFTLALAYLAYTNVDGLKSLLAEERVNERSNQTEGYTAPLVAEKGTVLFWDEHCELFNLVGEILSLRLLAGNDRAEIFEEYTA